ncbi:hypothetical protein OVA07_14090 [Novosphingobium sp. SL115]|uniref:GTP pyrophosphokinase n=1 Tax=Novosphingobium sp. SL115 TaxID=2995150 RepID=UPI0022749CDD|nr:hypothetical protein [Novosphingobium sp. SL115]MCY1672134.1 hypothetical protein [Novosphingobium sp. SL115]
MTREAEFLERWAKEKPAYQAWGNFIADSLKAALRPLIAVDVDYFLKVPVHPRTKESHKLIEKAFYRPGKNYADPYSDITDKVGIRFVVLLGTDIRLVEQALTGLPRFVFSRDRDHEEEQAARPIEFDYAAVHYVVRPSVDITINDVRIPADTPCEVQIKTILQHAYSELTHDTIYKPQIQATHVMRRNAAKSMALLEATNDYFERVDRDVKEALASVRDITRAASEVYRHALGLEPKPSGLEGLLAGAYEEEYDGQAEYTAAVKDLIEAKPFLPELIRSHLESKNPIFAQPSILLVYLIASRNYRDAIRLWPLTLDLIEPLLNDIGESVYN